MIHFWFLVCSFIIIPCYFSALRANSVSTVSLFLSSFIFLAILVTKKDDPTIAPKTSFGK